MPNAIKLINRGDVFTQAQIDDKQVCLSSSGDDSAQDLTDFKTAIGLSSTDTPSFSAIELGHASDTTLSRSAAGKIAVEGVDVVLAAGTQTIAGDKTFSGEVSFSTMPKVSAYKSVDQTGLTTGAYNKITFDTEEYDIGSNFASSTFTAPFACKVEVKASVLVSGTAGVDALAVYQNGTQVKRLDNKTTQNSELINGSVIISCAASDTLEIYYYAQNARDVVGASTVTWVQFTALP